MGQVSNVVATWLNLPDPEQYTEHSFRRTSANFLADDGGNENDLMIHGGWKLATVAGSYVVKSLYNQREINKKNYKRNQLKRYK